ncbi:hypothetical protein KBY76_02910 [Synechococcus sp. GreenBA-s]|nr:hypothetical protein [Synechococcus sp. GreenBA-s]
MCFSSTASFTAAVVLGPLGLLAVRQARRIGQAGRLPLALTPWLFSLQQASEGVVWLGLDDPGGHGDVAPLTRAAALLFLFFALGLWPAWMPWLALRFGGSGLEPWRRRLIQLLALVGLAFGLGLWLPLALDPDRLQLVVVGGSIHYATTFLGSGVISHNLGSGLFALLVALPPLLVPSGRLRLFGLLMLLAFALAQLAYLHAFTSVWCFFAALLSALAVWVVAEPPRPPLTPPPRTAGPPPP